MAQLPIHALSLWPVSITCIFFKKLFRMLVFFYTNTITRAGRYLAILVIPWYWDQTIRVSSKFQWNHIIAFGILNSFEYREIGITYTTEDKSLVLGEPNQWKRLKIPNRTVNPQAFVKSTINSNIADFCYTIYQALNCNIAQP